MYEEDVECVGNVPGEKVSKMTLPSGPSHHTFGVGSPLGLSQKISTVPFSGTANLWLGISGAGSRDVLLLTGSISVYKVRDVKQTEKRQEF